MQYTVEHVPLSGDGECHILVATHIVGTCIYVANA